MNKFRPAACSCPVCGSTAISPWLIKEKYGIQFKLWRCKGCASGFMDPMPTQEFLQIVYSNKSLGTAIQPLDSFEEIMVSEIEYPNATIDAKRLVSNAYKNKIQQRVALKALDIGSGHGFFSNAAIASGFEVTAVNPASFENEVFMKMNGFYPIAAFFEDVDFGTEKFDLVILSHVLEHFPDPFQILLKIRNLLTPLGVLAVAVPNIDSFLIKLFGSCKEMNFLTIPQHLTHFSRKGLEIILKRAGLDVQSHMYISRIPYNAISNRLNLQGTFRKIMNFCSKFGQWAPLKIANYLGFGHYHNCWARISGKSHIQT